MCVDSGRNDAAVMTATSTPQASSMTHQGGQVDHAGILDCAFADAENDTTKSIDELAFGHDPSSPTQRLHRVLLFVTVLCCLAALAIMSGQDPHEPAALEWLPTPVTILVLGDRSAKPQGCSGCFNYVDQSAAAWSQRGRRRVRIDHMTVTSDMGAPSMQTLVDMLRSNPDIRKAVSEADVILLAMGSGESYPSPLHPAVRKISRRAQRSPSRTSAEA